MKEIGYLCIESENGFGNSASNLIGIIKEFEDVNLTVIPLNKPLQQYAVEKEYDIIIAHIGLNSIASELQKNMVLKTMFSKAKKKLCYVLWEADRFSKAVTESLRENFDEYIAPSKFIQKMLDDMLEEVGMKKPVWYVPISIDRKSSDLSKKSDKFTVLSIGQWSARKCFDIMTVAYATAFAGKQDVRMIFKIGEKIAQETPENLIRGNIGKSMITNSPPIYIVEDHLPEEEMHNLYEISNTYLHISRGEGFGITPLTAMAHGLPVISTDWSAHTEFCNKSTANIKVKGHMDIVHSMHANFGYEPEMQWFEPHVGDIVLALRFQYEKWKNKTINYEIEAVVGDYSKDNVGNKAYEVIFGVDAKVKLKKPAEEIKVGDMTFTSI